MVALRIDGIDRTDLFQRRSLEIVDRLNARTTCRVLLKDEAAAYRPDIGEPIEVDDEADLAFAGTVDEPSESRPHKDFGPLSNAVQCVDHHQLADRRIVAQAFDDTPAGTIVEAIRATYLAGDGITAGDIQAGPTIERAVFNYIAASRSLDELSELAALQWVIRPNKALDFFARETFTAPWAADTTAALIGVRRRRDRQQYRNRQFVRAGKDRTDIRTDAFVGDGERKTFSLVFPVATVPTVEVNGSPQTVGIRGVETGKDWYWNKEEREITQDDAAIALSGTDGLEVTYRGLFPIVVRVDDGSAQSERVGVEGGAGIYEHVADVPNVDSAALAEEVGSAKLRRFARIAQTLTYQTYQSDLRVGMLQTVDLPYLDTSGTFLIDSIHTTDPGRGDGKLLRTVTALDGEGCGGWVAFFRELAAAGRSFVIRESEVLVRVHTLADGLTLADTLTSVSAAPESRVDHATVDFSQVSA